MKKLFTSVLFVLSALTMQAEDYTGNLNVIVPEEEININQNATITVNKQDNNKYELIIKNFCLGGNAAEGIGTINVKDVEVSEYENFKTLTYTGTTTIQPNEDGSTSSMAGIEVNVTLQGMLNDKGMRANINIEVYGLEITVIFTPDGQKTQIPNSDFELFHEAEYAGVTTQEANHWHSFTSADADNWPLNEARKTKQSTFANETRPGSDGTKCLKISSAIVSVWGISKPANGTVTTGRLKAGSAKPENTSNCAYINLSNTKLDDNGDPFYTTLTTKPDAVEFWARFKQGEDNEASKYASIRAVVTNGTYYQDPEDKTYDNVVAVASNKQIEGTDVWQKVTANFDYESYAANEAEPKAILVTISTNAEPGVASKDANNPDYIYIDDLSLIYNANLTSLKFKDAELFEAGKTEYETTANGTIVLSDIKVASDGEGAYKTVELEDVDGGCKATITITSNDLKTQNVYTLNIKGATTKINTPKSTTTQNGIQAIYNLAGQQVTNMASGNVYIVKTTDGKTKKVIKK